MRSASGSIGSAQRLLTPDDGLSNRNSNILMRDPSTISTGSFAFSKVLKHDADDVQEQTVMQVEIFNDGLMRQANRAKLASKGMCLTHRWQTALATSLVLVALAIAIGGIAYWISLPKVITQSYLLYGESCQMNSRSCDSTRMLWCPAGRCICLGDFSWNATSQNCSCGAYTNWNGVKCQGYGSYGDPCSTVPCRPTLKCMTLTNQIYTTHQNVCICDNATYLETMGLSAGQCLPRLTYNESCATNFHCQHWLGLSCGGSGLKCRCESRSYWNGSMCRNNALGWEFCNGSTTPCDTPRGLTCVANKCECDQYHYWDNITTLACQPKKTYAASCQFNFQCNTTVNLSCPTVSTGCNCYATSAAYMCDCQAGTFWDGQRCIAQHSFNGTCPGQYACLSSGNLVCFLGHCICPGNMVWNNRTLNQCDCTSNQTWNSGSNICH